MAVTNSEVANGNGTPNSINISDQQLRREVKEFDKSFHTKFEQIFASNKKRKIEPNLTRSRSSSITSRGSETGKNKKEGENQLEPGFERPRKTARLTNKKIDRTNFETTNQYDNLSDNMSTEADIVDTEKENDDSATQGPPMNNQKKIKTPPIIVSHNNLKVFNTYLLKKEINKNSFTTKLLWASSINITTNNIDI
ncbi:hypothetical protein PV327_010211 [Microctonus hyperodae]|uniref:Uncharacterized protein n=1 Tax=Microctonus hyperodae TaxID=165561 RepID=A0AA39FRF1_MICHY|nr:hypothetical protein PV327_010211 [Microctonus hyperodae]